MVASSKVMRLKTKIVTTVMAICNLKYFFAFVLISANMAIVSKQQAARIIELAMLIEVKSLIIFRKSANIQATVNISFPRPKSFNIFLLSLVA
ncbi:hypothetical protein GCM10022250_32420 [Flavobacterium chungbukense]|uniref:Uncharacterized protein n=1 Tax=Flavobacterium chungbukense TaxID=877464 RepID=A0ABP7YHA6_9FLAO